MLVWVLAASAPGGAEGGCRTRGEALLELLGLLRILEDKGVQVPLAADLELDLLGALVLLNARGCVVQLSEYHFGKPFGGWSSGQAHTRSIASPADLDELVDFVSRSPRVGDACSTAPS